LAIKDVLANIAAYRVDCMQHAGVRGIIGTLLWLATRTGLFTTLFWCNMQANKPMRF